MNGVAVKEQLVRGGSVAGRRLGDARRTRLVLRLLTTKPPSSVTATPNGVLSSAAVAEPPFTIWAPLRSVAVIDDGADDV